LILLLDACFPPKLARALEALNQEDCQYHHSSAVFGQDAEDEVIIQGAAARGWILVTQDARMSKNPHQRAAILEAGIGAFAFIGTATAQKSLRKMAAFVLDVADEMIEKASTTRRPFIWGITDRKKFRRLDGDAA
jgi:hypothetical protein